MTYVLLSGAESGIAFAGSGGNGLRMFDTSQGSPAISTGVVNTGSRSWEFVANATDPFLRHIFSSANTIMYGRVFFRLTDATPTSTVTMLEHSLGGSDVYVQVTTGGVLQINHGTTTTTGPTLSDNTWYGIEYQIDVSANPNVTKWRTYAGGSWTDQSDVSFAQAATTCTSVYMGNQGPSSGVTVYTDDLILGIGSVANAEYSLTVPQGGVLGRLLPTSDGTHSFTAGDFGYGAAGSDVSTSATDVYSYLDDSDQSDISDFIRQKVIRAAGYLELQFENPPSDHAPVAVAVTAVFHSASTGANTISIKASDDNFSSTTNVLTDSDVSDTTAHVRHLVMATKPSGGAWTNSALASTKVRVGYSSDVTDIPYIDSVSLEYLYDVDAPAPGSDTIRTLTALRPLRSLASLGR